MELAGARWLPAWLASLDAFTRGGTGDPTVANPSRQLMINLQVVLHAFTDDRRLVNAATLVVLGGGLHRGHRAFVIPGAALMSHLARSSAAGPLAETALWRLLSFHQVAALGLVVLALVWGSLRSRDSSVYRVGRRASAHGGPQGPAR